MTARPERFLRDLLRAQRRHVWLGTGIGLLAALATVGLMAVGGGLLTLCAVSGLVSAGSWNPAIGRLSAAIRFFAILRTAGRYGERVYTHDATFRILTDLRVRFFARLAPQVPAALAQARSGDLLQRLVADVDALAGYYIRVLSPWTWAAVLVALLGGFLAWFDVRVALAAVGVLVLAAFILPAVGDRLTRAVGARLASRAGQLRVRLLEALRGRQELLVYGAAARTRDALYDDDRAWLGAQADFHRRVAVLQATYLLLAGAGLFVALLLGVGAVRAGRLEASHLAVVVLAVMTSFEVLAPLVSGVPERGRVHAAVERVQAVLDAPAVAPPPAEPKALPPDTTLEVTGMTFRYGPQSPPALRDLDLQVAPGERVAVLGPSGSGKTTLLHLLARFWDPETGHIRLGGVDLRRLSEADLRARIAAVPQRPHLFSGTVADNLRLGDPEATEQALRDVLSRVSLAEDVAALPDGLQTWLGDAASGGVRLSGGQARRLALARALLRRAPILVLDEPTEDLDPPTARRVLDHLLAPPLDGEGTAPPNTRILITHRLEGLEAVDRILILEGGRLVEQGDHACLVAAGGRYAALRERLRTH